MRKTDSHNPIFLPRGKRYWIELDRKITGLYLSGASYHQVKTILDRAMEWDCGLMSLWKRFQKVARIASLPGPGGDSQSVVSG